MLNHMPGRCKVIKAAKGDHHVFESYIHILGIEIVLLLLTFSGIWIALTLSDIVTLAVSFNQVLLILNSYS